MDVISSYRAKGYVDHFKKHGFDPTLVTHHWQNDLSKLDISFDKSESGTVIRIPLKKTKFSNFVAKIETIKYISRLSIFIRWIFGLLDSDSRCWDSYWSMKQFTFKYLEMEKFDIVMGIFSPHYHLKLCYEINRRFGIPYFIDFRDLWDNRVIHRDYLPTITEKIQDFIIKYHWKRWLVKSIFFSVTSKEWAFKIKEILEIDGIVILNGYEEWDVSKNKNSGIFTILHGGNLYTHQKLDIFLNGCKMFIEKCQPSRFVVKFIGARTRDSKDRLSSYLSNPHGLIRQYLEPKYCIISGRIPKKKLMEEMALSSLLLFPSFPNSPGTYAGKIFDYLGSYKNILVVPDDNNVISELIGSTKAGFIVNTPDEVCELLEMLYSEWEENNNLIYNGVKSEIRRFSREAQVSKLAKVLKKKLNEN